VLQSESLEEMIARIDTDWHDLLKALANDDISLIN
jgi:hypothetical protein